MTRASVRARERERERERDREQKPNVIQTNESKRKKKKINVNKQRNPQSDIYHFDGYLRSVVFSFSLSLTSHTVSFEYVHFVYFQNGSGYNQIQRNTCTY